MGSLVSKSVKEKHVGIHRNIADTNATRNAEKNDSANLPPPFEYSPPRHGRHLSGRSRRSHTSGYTTTETVAENASENDISNNQNLKRKLYSQDGYGLNECTPYDFRSSSDVIDKRYADLPEVSPCNMPTVTPFRDHYFGPNIALPGVKVGWKRPTEFCDKPVLVSDERSPLGIGHAVTGTHWFLSLMSMLRDIPGLFHRIVPEDAWDADEGSFLCCLWRFGKWETFYIDDFLPIVDGNELWGSKYVDNKNEMWPALLEKVFARLYGNYNTIYDGYCGDTFQTLTGGCSEYIDFGRPLEEDVDHPSKKIASGILRRLKNACRRGNCMLLTEMAVHGKDDCPLGFARYKAYAVTSIKSEISQSKSVNIVKIQDPCQLTSTGEDIFSRSDSAERNPDFDTSKDEGTVWITFEDFIKYFSGVTICWTVPSCDMDDECYCTQIYGEWYFNMAAGSHDRISNPRFIFRVKNEGGDGDWKVPIVVQICQKLKDMKLIQFSIRVDLYKILGEETHVEKMCAVQLLGDTTNVYYKAMQMTNGYRVPPGYYMAVPSNIEVGQEKEFLVRIFSAGPIDDVREIGSEYSIFEFDEVKHEFKPDDNICLEPPIKHSQTILIKWKVGEKEASKQDTHSRVCKYPRVDFDIPYIGESKEQLVTFTLMQERRSETFPLEFKVFKVESSQEKIPDCLECGYQYAFEKSLIRDMSYWGNGMDGLINFNSHNRNGKMYEVGNGVLQVTEKKEYGFGKKLKRKMTQRELEKAEIQSLDSYSEFMKEAQATSRSEREFFETKKLYYQLKIQSKFGYYSERGDSN